MPCQDFFAIMSRFSSEFAAARDNIERMRKMEERREKAKLEAEKRTALKAAKAAAVANVAVDNASLTAMKLVTPGNGV